VKSRGRFGSLEKKRAPGTRPYVSSSILRETPRGAGGGRDRKALVARSREMIRLGSRSFHAASRLFDRQTRERVWLLYAWCRRCDDIADAQELGGELGDNTDAADRVKAIRVLTRRALEGAPTADFAFDAFGQVAQETGLDMTLAEDVIAGFELDAADWRPRTEFDLLRYCYHVAGAVGVMMARVMGVARDDEQVLDRACDLGLSFQLANIARDVWEDDAAGRCYLPCEWLVEQDIEPGQHMKPHHRGELVEMVRRLTDLSLQYRQAALAGTRALAFRQRWAIHAAARIYGAIAEEVAERGGAAWDHRVVVPAYAKLRHVGAAYFDAIRKSHPMPVPAPKITRGDILLEVRMSGPIADIPMGPLPDDA
jgi:phytoene synthase